VDWIDLLGWGGSALLVWSLLQTRLMKLRVWNLVGCVALIVFNTVIRVWPMVGLNVVLAAINIWYIVRMARTRHDERAYVVIPLGADDAFVAHLVRLHAADITRFTPAFNWDTARADGWAFLILSRDEIVGIVIGHGDPDDPRVARIELDYVLPRYRDFTPGEFVYRRSRLFTDRGYRRVVSPPGMVAPYYPRLGFRREGESYILDL
jgi:hypothetical protein